MSICRHVPLLVCMLQVLRALLIRCMQGEHAQALAQEHSRLLAVTGDFEAQLRSTQRQLAAAQQAAETAESRAKLVQQDSMTAISQLQVCLHSLPPCIVRCLPLFWCLNVW